MVIEQNRRTSVRADIADGRESLDVFERLPPVNV